MSKEFEKAYLKLIQETNQNLLTEGKFLNNLMAGVGGLAITGGAALGLNELSKTNNSPKTPVQVPIVQSSQPIPDPMPQIKMRKRPKPNTQISQDNTWVTNLTMPFIMKYEGKILDQNGNHVLYDDDVNVPTHKKRRWDGKGGQEGINKFILSCKGKPTIGYGITDKDIIQKGKITDSEAKDLVLKRIKRLNLHLFKNYPVYSKLNPNQKTALISFTFNLGQHFIELQTKKMKKHLLNGNLDGACYEMHDCNKVRVGKQKKLVESKGLTNRRQAEMKLFKTPWKGN